MRPDPKGSGTMCPCAVASKIMRLVENPPPTALHMLRRCVGFSWAKPLCYEKRDASPCVPSVLPHAGSPFPCFPYDPWTPKSPSNHKYETTIAFFRLKKAYLENAYYPSPFSIRLILQKNMVPYRLGIWYHILLVNGTIFFSNISLFQNQRGYDSISTLAFFNFKKANIHFRHSFSSFKHPQHKAFARHHLRPNGRHALPFAIRPRRLDFICRI